MKNVTSTSKTFNIANDRIAIIIITGIIIIIIYFLFQKRFQLPSVFQPIQNGRQSRRVRPKSRTSFRGKIKEKCKEIVCIPYSNEEVIPIPRREKREHLARKGLLGSITLKSTYDDENVKAEITSVFRSSFNLSKDEGLDFVFLRVLPNSKKLSKARKSSEHVWGGTEVMTLCSRSCLYIMSAKKYMFMLELPLEVGATSVVEMSACSDFSEMKTDVSPSENSSRLLCSSQEQFMDSSFPKSETSFLNNILHCDEVIEISDSEEPEIVTPIEEDYADVIKKHIENVVEAETLQHLRVRRSNAYTDALRWYNRTDFKATAKLCVKFVGENGIDQGGPTRDFLQILLYNLANSRVFNGDVGSLFVSTDVDVVAKNLLFTAGKMIASIVCQGGPPVHLFSESLLNVIAGIPNKEITDVPNKEIRSILTNIKLGNVLDPKARELEQEVQYSEALSFNNKEQFVLHAVNYFTAIKPAAAILQFSQGLDTMQVRHLIQQHPTAMKRIFCAKYLAPLDANAVYEMFAVTFSEEGSNDRLFEEEADVNFIMFLHNCMDLDAPCTLGDFLHFVTGASKVPPGGYEVHPTVVFTKESVLPVASTCAIQLTLPLKLDEKQFFEAMTLAILGSSGFDLS